MKLWIVEIKQLHVTLIILKVLSSAERGLNVGQPLNDYRTASTSREAMGESLQALSDRPEAGSLTWGESLAAAMRRLSTDPKALAKVEKRAF